LQYKHPRSVERVIRSDKPVTLLLLLWSPKCDFGAEPRSRIIATSAVKGLKSTYLQIALFFFFLNFNLFPRICAVRRFDCSCLHPGKSSVVPSRPWPCGHLPLSVRGLLCRSCLPSLMRRNKTRPLTNGGPMHHHTQKQERYHMEKMGKKSPDHETVLVLQE
jgi:hypothetical protein